MWRRIRVRRRSAHETNDFVDSKVVRSRAGKTLDQRMVWRMILESVAASAKHQDCLRMLANVVIQRVLCRLQHSKDVVAYVYELVDEIFTDKAPDDQA